MISEPSPSSSIRSPGWAGAILGLFATIFFARAWMVREWGSALPFYDQWGAEGLALYRPWLTKTFNWTFLFSGHNEHRIALTRLIDLALFAATGKWLTWWQLLINAALQASCAVLLAHFLWRQFSPAARTWFILGLVLFFAGIPGWQNALWGFCTPFYFNHLFTILGFSLLAGAAPLCGRWWAGAGAILVGLFSNGAGLPAAGVALLLSAATFLANRDQRSRAGFALAILVAIVAFGWTLRPDVGSRDQLHVSGFSQLVGMFVHCLSWPYIESSTAWLALQAPLIWLLVRALRQRRWPDAGERLVLALGIFTALLALAMAYTRGSVLQRPIPRYQDTLMLGLIANLGVAVRAAVMGPRARIAAALWCGFAFIGLIQLSADTLALQLRIKTIQDRNGLAEIRSYVANRDPRVFLVDPQETSLSLDWNSMLQVMNDPILQPILPEEFRDPNVQPPALIRHSPYLLLLSLSGLACSLALSFRSSVPPNEHRPSSTPAPLNP